MAHQLWTNTNTNYETLVQDRDGQFVMEVVIISTKDKKSESLIRHRGHFSYTKLKVYLFGHKGPEGNG
jgi:hypothetical protein